MKQEIPKVTMSREERDLRSRAAKLVAGAGLVHGYVSTRYQVCGTKNCRCYRGEKHQAFVLVLRREGKTVQVPIPRWLEPPSGDGWSGRRPSRISCEGSPICRPNASGR